MMRMMLDYFLVGMAFAGGAAVSVAVAYLLIGALARRRRLAGKYRVKLAKEADKRGL